MVNLCNGGTKDFGELWEIIHLNIYSSEHLFIGNYSFEQLFIRTQITESITVKPVLITTLVKRPMVSLPKQIPIQSLLYKTMTSLRRPANTFFDSEMKKKKKTV